MKTAILTLFLLASLTALHAADTVNAAAQIAGATLVDFSSEDTKFAPMAAANVVKEQGAWRGSALPAQVTLDLGSYYDVNTLDISNYFEAQVPGREAKEVEVWVASEPDSKFVQIDGDANSPGLQPFILGKGRENIHKSIDLSNQAAADDVRRVRLIVLNSHGGSQYSGLARVKFQGTELPAAGARNQALAQRREQAEQILSAARQKVLAGNRAEYEKVGLKGRPDMRKFEEFHEHRVASLGRHAQKNDIEAAMAKLWLHVDGETPDFWKDKPKEELKQLAANHTAVQHPNGDIWGDLARFCLNTNVEEANRIITKADLKKYPWHAHFDLVGLHNMFNADNGTHGKRLSREATDRLRAYLWDSFVPETRIPKPFRVYHILPDEPWWTWGNQNHRFVCQSFYYGAASILKDFPQYAGKFDAGKMISWGQGAEKETHPELAKISLAEFAERGRQFWRNRLEWMSRHGIWAEDMEYRNYDIEVLYHLLGSSPDPVIRRRAEMMLDIHWLMYALQTVHGQLGGAQNRYKLHYVGTHPERDRAGYYFGKLAGAENGSSVNAAMVNYIPPAIAYELLANPEKRGAYTYRERLQNLGPISQRDIPLPGEQPPLAAWKQSYVTPEFVLGAYIKHSELDQLFRYSERAFQGITFGKSRAILNLREMATWQPYHGLQHGPILLARWFGKDAPFISIMRTEAGGAEVAAPVSEGGWVFGQAGDAYYALRPAEGEFAIGKTGMDTRELRHFDFPENKQIPFVLHAGGATEDGSFEQFKKKVLANTVAYADGVLTYKDAKWGAMEFCPDPAKPADRWRRIDGKPVELPKKLFDSPYLTSDYGSGIITAQFGDQKLILDFNKNELLAAEFDYAADLRHWRVEQMPGGSVTTREGALVIEDAAGCTVWFREKLTAPVEITYEITPVAKGGPRDRVSDVNCFWMARDRKSDTAMPAQRSGTFSDYDSLLTYYVGMGGNNNSTTRFRRYDGTAARPLLPEHDLSEKKFLLEANHTYRIRLVAREGVAEYWRDGEKIFTFRDPAPLTAGWFAFRTVRSHLVIRNFHAKHKIL